MPLLVLLLGGGLFLFGFSRLTPLRYTRHALNILRGKYDDAGDPGDISHYQALASALAATIGMGNISGVAIAITTGGPGAIFWMWMSALVGTATKFFTCTLAIMYRGNDSNGKPQGGPMYVIREGMKRRYLPLAYFFAAVGVLGCAPLFVSNQMTKLIIGAAEKGGISLDFSGMSAELVVGLAIALLSAVVIFGGIKRIAQVASKLVPAMICLYVLLVSYILISRADGIIDCFALIFADAFTGDAVVGGALGTLIIQGVRRAAFSNEAGIGTEAMAHGAAKTKEPVREGLIAMLGPGIDTLVVCTLTALAILLTGAWRIEGLEGINLTVRAFELGAGSTLGHFGLVSIALIFGITTVFTYSYYGAKCLDFLVGKHFQESKKAYNILYVALIVVGSLFSLKAVVGFLDGCYALMAIPTMFSTLYLSPVVMQAAKEYFAKLNKARHPRISTGSM